MKSRVSPCGFPALQRKVKAAFAAQQEQEDPQAVALRVLADENPALRALAAKMRRVPDAETLMRMLGAAWFHSAGLKENLR